MNRFLGIRALGSAGTSTPLPFGVLALTTAAVLEDPFWYRVLSDRIRDFGFGGSGINITCMCVARRLLSRV